MTRRVLGLALLGAALAVTVADGALTAYEAGSIGRAPTVDVVGNGAAYIAFSNATIDIPQGTPFTGEVGLLWWNNSTATVRLSWVEESDPHNVITGSTNCASVAAGASCSVTFSGAGPATANHYYTFGRLQSAVDGSLTVRLETVNIHVYSCKIGLCT